MGTVLCFSSRQIPTTYLTVESNSGEMRPRTLEGKCLGVVHEAVELTWPFLRISIITPTYTSSRDLSLTKNAWFHVIVLLPLV